MRLRGFKLRIVKAAGLLLCFMLLGLMESYSASQATRYGVILLSLLSLTVLTGYVGIVSLGQGAFMAIGGYGVAILQASYAIPIVPAVFIAIIITSVAGFICSLPALRLSGPYVALVTFGLALGIPQILKHSTLAAWTGGVGGLFLDVTPEAMVNLGAKYAFLDHDHLLLYATAGAIAITIMFLRRLRSSSYGRALLALRDNDLASGAYGINVSLYQMGAFTASAGIAGLAGALSALATQYIAPDSYPFMMSLILLVGLIVGGSGTILGTFIGALFVFYVPDLALKVSTAAPTMLYGACLILTLVVFPRGMAGIATTLMQSIKKMK